ncbi:MAG: dipeptidase PepV [Anaerovoracaceae bacterium]
MEAVQKIKAKIEENWEEELTTLRELIAIKSVEGPATEACPFGEGVQEAFSYVMEKGREWGFSGFNADNYGGHLDYGREAAEEVMGIVCHLDVVPEGNGWTYPPFGGEVQDGRMYGRGTNDDKGPTVAALYAMKAIRDAGILPNKKVRLILGLDEETNWAGMDYYLSKAGLPDFGFTPDSDFPAVNGEMGILVFDLAKKFSKGNGQGLVLKSFVGGSAPNMVADYARVVINGKNPGIYEGIKTKVASLRELKQMQITAKAVGKSLEVVVKGVSAHGARPESGENAISLMMAFLGELTFGAEDVNEFIEFYNRHIGMELNGASLGCRLADLPSGETILNVGQIELNEQVARLTINVRYPVTCNEEQVYGGMEEVCRKYNLGIVKHKHQAPVYLPQEDEMIKTLMDIYRQHTGDEQSEPLVIGGGTYARAFNRVVAFGIRFPSEEECAHQKDEWINLENLKKITEIYADTIYQLTK